MLNIDAIARVIGYIELFERNHDQGVWAAFPGSSVTAAELREPKCGTRLCAAGWTAALFAPADAKFYSGGAAFYDSDGYSYSIPHFAQDTLGLSNDQRRYVFHETTDDQVVPALRYIVNHPKCDYYELRRAVRGY